MPQGEVIASSSKEDLLCFEHCDKKMIFCASSAVLPSALCPVCQTSIPECKFQNPPFKLPSPFSRAQDHPCTLVIKPTKGGSFLRDYVNHGNLHIAVTNSNGIVVEYDMDGIHKDRTQDWSQCIVIDLVKTLAPDLCSDPDWSEYWDKCLENTLKTGFLPDTMKGQGHGKSPKNKPWSKEAYHEQEYNCFVFVLNFLKSLKQDPISSEARKTRLEFCRKYILPKTTLAGKYICLYRKVKHSETSKNVKNDITVGLFILNKKSESSKEAINDFSDSYSWEENINLLPSLSSSAEPFNHHQDKL